MGLVINVQKAVLVFPVRDNMVLLGKKVGKIGAGCLNGYGGKIEEGETAIQAACREFKEETGGAEVRPQDLVTVADAYFHNTDAEGVDHCWEVRVYLARHWFGRIGPTATMTDPRWYTLRQVDTIPKHLLMPGDHFWLPKVVRGQQLRIEVWYGPDQKELIRDVSIQPAWFNH